MQLGKSNFPIFLTWGDNLRISKLPWTVVSIILKLNILGVLVSILFYLGMWLYCEFTVATNLQLFDRALSSMNYIERDVAISFTGRANLDYLSSSTCVFDNLDTLGIAGFYFENPALLTGRNGRNYGSTCSYTFVVPFKTNVFTTFGTFSKTFNLRFDRVVPCLRRFKN